MKKVLSFTLAVALAFSLLLGSAFASSGVTVVAPDTFISWGSAGDLTSLAVPSAAVSDGNKYIIYQVRDWVVSYFRVRFVIDSFTRGDPVEGETLSWTRYTGAWGLGVNAALEPASYEVEYHAAEEYTYSQSFLHLPVKSNFDYYDSNGDLIISGSGYVNDFEGLVDLTLTDGTVIQVPRRLVGNQFVVVRSASDSSQYKIWNFGTPDTLNGIYEGAEGVRYSTSDGTLISAGFVAPSVTFSWYTYSFDFDLSQLDIDYFTYPYLICYVTGYSSSYCSFNVIASASLPSVSSSSTTWNIGFNNVPFVRYSGTYYTSSSSYNLNGPYVSSSDSFKINKARFGENQVFSNYQINDYDGNLIMNPNISLVPIGGSWSWSDWEISTATLALTSYGDIVYQTFDYPLSNPDPEPSPSPGGTPDDSNNGLFVWLKTQWVFLLQKLQNIADAIKNLAFDLDPYPDKTKPLLDDFFTNIFDNGVGEDDVSDLGGVLQNVRPWFKTGFKLGDLWDLFNEAYMTSWFTEETRLSIDSTGGNLNGS